MLHINELSLTVQTVQYRNQLPVVATYTHIHYYTIKAMLK